MKRFFILASLALALTIVSAVNEEPKIVYVYEGSTLRLTSDEFDSEVTNCTVESNDGKVFEIPTGSFWNRYCSYNLEKASTDVGGKWTIKSLLENGNAKEIKENKFTVIVKREVDIKPSEKIQLIAGEWATAWFDDDETDVISCQLQSDKVAEPFDLLNGNYSGVERYYQCGVRMIAERDDTWILSRKFSEYVMDVSRIDIHVYAKSENKKVIHRTFNLGKKANLKVDGNLVFCRFTRPDGSITEIQYNKCTMTFDRVTSFHRGVWAATYAVTGKMALNVMEFHVDTWDQDALNGTLIRGNNGELHLLCRAGVSTLTFCSFIRPDEQVIHVPVGTGTDEYQYYGEGFSEYDDRKSRNYADCGLTIRKPSTVDFGLWTCELGIKKDEDTKVRGTVINVVQSRAESTYKSAASKVYVERGDSFKIRCTLNAMLRYCWLTSPNGTIYSVLPDSPSGSDLEYDGKGFGMGECGAIVKNANTTDNGNWTCHFGLSSSGTFEIEQVVPVQVTDSYLIAVEEKVYARENANLQVRTFFEGNGALKYCRWVRPNGHGIDLNDSDHYVTIMELNRCKLFIKKIVPEDVGTWTCFALLAGSVNSEQKATVELEQAFFQEMGTTKLLSIILGCGLLVLILISIILTGIYISRRRDFERFINRPPPYDPQLDKMPQFLTVKPDNGISAKFAVNPMDEKTPY